MRMLGRFRSGGCGCGTPGPDCSGHERDTRRRKRQEAVSRELAAEIHDGLLAAALGRTEDLGSFAQYAGEG